MSFYNKKSLGLLLLFVLIPVSPIACANTIFLIGLICRIKGSETRLNSNVNYQLWLCLAVFLFFGVIPSLDKLQSLKTIGRMLPAVLAIFGTIEVLRFNIDNSSKNNCNKDLIEQDYFFSVVSMYLSSIIVLYAFFIAILNYKLKIEFPLAWAYEYQNVITTVILLLVCALATQLVARVQLWNLILAIILCGSTIVFEGRGAFVSGIFILGFVGALRFNIFKKFYLLIVLLVSLVIGAVSACLWLWNKENMNTPFDLNYFLSGRIELWQASIEVIKQKMWFGIGIGTWQKSDWVNSLLPMYKNKVSPHNIFLDLISSVGIVGTVFFIMLVALYITSLRSLKLQVSSNLRNFGLFVFLATIVNGLVDFRLFGPQFITITSISLLFWLAGTNHKASVSAV